MSSGTHKRYKVTHVVRRFVPEEWGGIETSVLNTCLRLQDWGNTVSIIATAALSQPGSERVAGIQVERFNYLYPFVGLTAIRRKQMDKKGGNPISLSLLWHLVRQPDIDLVHLHTMGRLGAQVRTACLIRRIPYVVTLQGGQFCVPEQEQQYFEELSNGCFDYGKPLALLFGTRRVLSDAATIICIGYDEYCAARDRYPEKRVVYLSHGVDPKCMSSGDGERFRASYSLQGRRIILCVGRIDPQKNQLALVRALPLILNGCPEAALVLIGPVTVPSYLRDLQGEIIATGRDKQIRIIPGLHPSSRELRDAYAACDVFVLPSIHEPCGVVILEAWACSKPVVISPLASLQHVVQDGGNGIWVRDASAEELARGILRVLEDRSLARRLGQAGHATVQAHYNWDRIIQRLLDLYGEILDNRNGSKKCGSSM